VARALHSLAARGWIERLSQGTVYDPARYRLRLPAATSDTPDVSTGRGPVVSLKGSGQVLLALAFGPYAGMVYAALDYSPHTGRAVAERAGVSRDTARKHLRRLLRVGLADRDEDGWRVGLVDPDEVALDHDVVRLAIRRATRHAQERGSWQRYLDLGRSRYLTQQAPGLKGISVVSLGAQLPPAGGETMGVPA
jgi:DNA-binding transcriptional ArsR family regulator